MAKKDPKTVTELQPGSNDWLKAYEALSPQDQASIFNFQSDPTGGAFDYTFEDAAGGGITAGTGYPNAPGFQGYEMDPMFQQLAQFGGGVNIPQLSAKGALEPYDLQQEAARVNLMQDNATSMADLVLAAMSGPGAIDPKTFAPIVTKPTERIATPGLDRVRQYSQGTGAKAYIARKIMGGATDDEAIADLFNFIDTPDSATVSEADRKTKQMIIDSMPSAFKTGEVIPPSGRGTGGGARTSQDTRDLFNESSLATDAREMYEKAYEDQSKIDVGWEDPDKPGTYYTEAPTSEDSPAMQKFRNLGLPSPFAAYNDPEYLQMAYDTMAPNLASDLAEREENIARTQAEQWQVGGETRPIVDRNIALQKALQENYRPAGYAPPPGAGPVPTPLDRGPGMGGGTRMGPQPTGSPFAGGPTRMGPQQAGTPIGGAPTRMGQQPQMTPQTPPAPFALDPAVWREAGTKQNLSALANSQGGFDFGDTREIEQQALANAMLNFNFGAGGGKRGTKAQPLNKDTAKQSAKQAEEAHKKFSQANDRRYEATQYTSDDMGQAAYALGVANAMARAGNTPFIDVAKQRKLGQRAQGVRG